MDSKVHTQLELVEGGLPQDIGFGRLGLVDFGITLLVAEGWTWGNN